MCGRQDKFNVWFQLLPYLATHGYKLMCQKLFIQMGDQYWEPAFSEALFLRRTRKKKKQAILILIKKINRTNLSLVIHK